MNYRLAEAVIASFQAMDGTCRSDSLATFGQRAWEDVYDWLDASGLALYFLDNLQSSGIEGAIPASVLTRLKKNYADNQKRSDRLFQEFIRINCEFAKEGLTYVNIKGFSMNPDACKDQALRCQLDLDFLVAYDDLLPCKKILERLGYILVGSGDTVMEYKTVTGEQIPSIKNLYKEKAQHCVEIHFDSSRKDMKYPQKHGPSKFVVRHFEGLEFPSLSDCDRFISQSLHLLKHLKGEWTRTSWMFEFANFVNFHQDNATLWREVEVRTAADSEIRVAVGIATSVSGRYFSIPALPEVLRSIVLNLPYQVETWVELYGEKVVYAQYPGTKLYLLLRQALATDNEKSSPRQIKHLLPFRRPARITVAVSSANIFARLSQERAEAKYFIIRLKFHLKQSCLYMVEAMRWKRKMALIQKQSVAA